MTALCSILLSYLLWLSTVLGQPGSIQRGMEESANMQREAIARLHGDFLGPSSQPEKREELSSTITFHNPKAKEFFVGGTTLPDGKIDTIHPSSLSIAHSFFFCSRV